MVQRKRITEIQNTVWNHYMKRGRHTLPWRKTKNPYRILVSEIMLQQTQVIRVVPKYKTFLKKFPTPKILAEAQLRNVLVEWQGLGYNRRAKSLHEAARDIVEHYGGTMPKTFEEFCTLPGVGLYTAGAVCAFAYNIPVPILETNIRTVLFHHAYKDKKEVSDTELLKLSEACLDTKRPREWYWAIMDYGAHLKESGVRVNAKSKHYTKQKKFKGSDREVRGAILRELSKVKALRLEQIQKKIFFEVARIKQQLFKLKKEGLIREKNRKWMI